MAPLHLSKFNRKAKVLGLPWLPSGQDTREAWREGKGRVQGQGSIPGWGFKILHTAGVTKNKHQCKKKKIHDEQKIQKKNFF